MEASASAVSCTRSPISLERRAPGSGAIEQLAEMDRLRLVPRDQRVAAGALAPLGADHLRPTRTAQPALDREPASRRQALAIPLEVPGQQVFPPPQGEVSRVPPDHLGVVLAVPGVAEEPALLRWHVRHRLDGSQVLRQDDAPLQLRRPRIRAAAEIDGSPPLPERRPVASRRAERLVHARKRVHPRRGEAEGQLERARAIAREQQLVPLEAQLGQRRVLAPREAHVKAGRVADTLQLQLPRASLDHARRVRLGLRPVERRGVLDLEAVPPGEGHAHALSSRCEQRGVDPDRHAVARRVNGRLDPDRDAPQPIAAVDDTRPEIEPLSHLAHVLSPDRSELGGGRLGEGQADAGQRQGVGVSPQPLPRRARGLRRQEQGSTRRIEALARIREGIARGIGLAVPGPAGQCLDRDPLGVVEITQRLEARHVHCEGELAVAHRERRARIDRRDAGIVPADEGPAIDRRGVRPRPCRGQRAQECSRGNEQGLHDIQSAGGARLRRSSAASRIRAGNARVLLLPAEKLQDLGGNEAGQRHG